MKKLKIAVGLSGGVDSAVSAYLLKKQGFDISGVYLHCFDDDEPGCRGKQDRQDALSVALHLKIPFQVLDFRKQYKTAVIGYFKKEYLAGRTPNPDVVCNRDIKFGLLLDWCIKNRFDYLATGHYAKLIRKTRKTLKAGESDYRRIRKSEIATPAFRLSDSPNFRSSEYSEFSEIYLAQPKDLHKDQTYFLWAVPRQNFSRVLFPLADFRKQDVRSVAKFAKIPVADKPDSTGICFIGEVRVEDFLKRLGVKEREGEVVIMNRQTVAVEKPISANGSDRRDRLTIPASQTQPPNDFVVVGSHRGAWFYTIGQRHGFSVDQWPPKNNTEYRMINTEWKERQIRHSEFSIQNSVFFARPPLYVIAKDVRRNRLVVGFGAETYRSQFVVSDTNWLIPNTEYRIPNGKYRIPNTEYRMTHSEFSIQNSVFKNCFVRIRHGGDLIPCSLSVNSQQLTVNGGSPFAIHDSLLSVRRSRFTVHLRFAQRGIAPGQSAVFYSKDGLVLGGGVIR